MIVCTIQKQIVTSILYLQYLQLHCFGICPMCSLLAQQETCLSSDCMPGTYSSVSTTAIGDLRLGSDVCVPCHPLCEVCTSPGTQWPTDCHLCRYATRTSERCAESCNNTTGKKTLTCTDLLQWDYLIEEPSPSKHYLLYWAYMDCMQ